MQAQCSICLEDKVGRVQGACVPCGHTFCVPCIREWSHTSNTCPQCRLDVQNVIRLYTDSEDGGGGDGQTRTRVACGCVSGLLTAVGGCSKALLLFSCHCYRRTRRAWTSLTVRARLFLSALGCLLLLLLLLDHRQPNGLLHGVVGPRLRPIAPALALARDILERFSRAVLALVTLAAESLGRLWRSVVRS